MINRNNNKKQKKLFLTIERRVFPSVLMEGAVFMSVFVFGERAVVVVVVSPAVHL